MLESMVVGMGTGLFKKTGRWQKGMDKIQTACPRHTDPTCKEYSMTNREARSKGEAGIKFWRQEKASPDQGDLCMRFKLDQN